MSPKKSRVPRSKSTPLAPEIEEPAASSFGVEFPSTAFTTHESSGLHSSEFTSSRDVPLVPDMPLLGPSASPELLQLLEHGDRRDLRRMITDAPLLKTGGSTEPIRKGSFLFGDSVADPKELSPRPEAWLYEGDGVRLYLPPFERHYSLVHLRHLSVKRSMPWRLTEDQERIHCGYVGQSITPGSSDRNYIRGLYPGIAGQDNPPHDELMIKADTVKNRLLRLRRELPPRKPHRCFGWVHSTDDRWWTRMTKYVLGRWTQELHEIGLYIPIRASMYGIPTSVHHFLALLETYNPDSNAFLIKNGELGLPLHEMMKVSGLPMGDAPYQEYFPTNRQLRAMQERGSANYEILWELTCHYQAAIAFTEAKSRKSPQVSLKQFADYLFRNLEGHEDISELTPLTPSAINKLIEKLRTQSFTTPYAEGKIPKGTKFETFLWHLQKQIKPQTLLAGYLAIWLKKCVVPHQSSDTMPLEVLFPAVELVVGRRLSLLPAMIADIHSGLRHLSSGFFREGKAPSSEIPSVRVELPYTYLMAWLVLHRPDLMTAPEAVGPDVPILQALENCKWRAKQWVEVCRQFKVTKCWEFFKCFPRFSGQYDEVLVDDAEPRGSRTVLDLGCFRWLMNIRPGYFIFRVKNVCYIEPYFPCRFARQFGYDQIYVGNPNRRMKTYGGLIDGARAWYWSITGCTQAKFSLPSADPKLQMTFLYCKWLIAASAPPSGLPNVEPTREPSPVRAPPLRRAPSRKAKGKKKVTPEVSEESEEEDFDDTTRTSEEETETARPTGVRIRSEVVVPTPHHSPPRRTKATSRAPLPPRQPLKRLKRKVLLTSPHRMTVETGEEEEETEEPSDLILRKRARVSETSHTPSSIARALLRTKKLVHRPRRTPPTIPETIDSDLPFEGEGKFRLLSHSSES